MKITKCDIKGCKKEAHKEVDVCDGYKLSTDNNKVRKKFKPFEMPHIRKMDLCDKHFKKWCKTTYRCFWKEEWKN